MFSTIIIIMEFVGGGSHYSFYFGLFVCLSVCLSVCLHAYCLFVCLFVCLFFHLSHQFHWNMKTRKARGVGTITGLDWTGLDYWTGLEGYENLHLN